MSEYEEEQWWGAEILNALTPEQKRAVNHWACMMAELVLEEYKSTAPEDLEDFNVSDAYDLILESVG